MNSSRQIQQFRKHINWLIRKFKLNVVWNDKNPRYSIKEHRVYLPKIRNAADYVVCLHEIGHSQDSSLREMWNRTEFYVKELRTLQGRLLAPLLDEQEITVLCSKVKKLSTESNRWMKQVRKVEHNWIHERNAWIWAKQSALVWNEECTKKLLQCMLSYYEAFCGRNKGVSYGQWIEQFIVPIAKS